MVQKFWVGGGSANTWAATANTNWALTSGGANNAAIPGTSDVATFDSNSGVGNSVIGASIAVQGLDCTGGTGNYAGTITHNAAVTLTINTGAASSLRLTSGMTYTAAAASSNITFTNTTGTAQITSAGKAFAAITVNGAGGTVQQQDNISINAVSNSTLTLTTGTWDCNSNTLTSILFVSTGAATRTFIGGGLIKIGGNMTSGNAWNVTSTLTFTKNSANIEVLPPTSAIYAVIFIGGNLSYNGLTYDASTNQSLAQISGTNTFTNLTVGSGWFVTIPAGTTTVTNAFTWVGTQANPIGFVSGNISSSATISVASGACSITWGAIFGIVASGGATFTATNTLNLGDNTGWSITPPTDGTATGIAASVWRDTTAGDFTVAGSIGKDLFVGGIAPGAGGGHFIAGTNAATSVTTALTANITGNVSGSVNSVTTRVTANSDQIAGSASAATNLGKSTNAIGRGTVTTGGSTTSVPTSALTLAGSAASGVVANQFAGRTILFDGDTTTAGLRDVASAISASSASNTPTFTVGTLPATPASGDLFSIL